MTTEDSKPNKSTQLQAASIRAIALGFPETKEDFPWGHSAFKVRTKTFIFMSATGKGLSLSLKLPESRHEALLLPFTAPTGYGLGKSGWVSASFDADQKAPMPLIARWIEESYRAIAPKKLSALLDQSAEELRSQDKSTRKKKTKATKSVKTSKTKQVGASKAKKSKSVKRKR